MNKSQQFTNIDQKDQERIKRMPVKKCPNGKYRIGNGPCMYKTKADAERAYKAYLAKKNKKG